MFWFFSNLKPYDLTDGGPWFGFAEQVAARAKIGVVIAGYGSGRYAPSPLDATKVLEDEFGEALPGKLIKELGGKLGSNWMWIEETPPFSEPTADEDLKKSIDLQLASLTSLFKQLQGRHGGIGHNSQADDLPVTNEEITVALVALTVLRGSVNAGLKMSLAVAQAMWEPIHAAATVLGQWAAKHIDTFVNGFVSEAGPALGKALPKIIGVGAAIWFGQGHVFDLISRLLTK